jgi:hypothetical protein
LPLFEKDYFRGICIYIKYKKHYIYTLYIQSFQRGAQIIVF